MKNQEYMTVSEVAEAAGLSKQAVYQKIKSNWNGLNNYLTTVDKQIKVNRQALIDVFKIDPVQQPSAADNDSEALIKVLQQTIEKQQSEIEWLKDRIIEKDKQISDLIQTDKLRVQESAYKTTNKVIEDQQPVKVAPDEHIHKLKEGKAPKQPTFLQKLLRR